MQPFFCKTGSEVIPVLKHSLGLESRKRFPLRHSSLISISKAEISLWLEVPLGKTPATLVLRGISLLTRSKLLVMRMRRRVLIGAKHP